MSRYKSNGADCSVIERKKIKKCQPSTKSMYTIDY